MIRQAILSVWACTFICLSVTATAHPMGNFSINHYARWQASGGQLELRYVLDMAEIPTITEKSTLDRDGKGIVTAAEKTTYLASRAADLAGHLALTINGSPARIVPQDATVELRPGAASLDTMRVAFRAVMPLEQTTLRRGCTVTYRDDNYPQRTGWKEIVVSAERGVSVIDSDAPTVDQSHELNVYPTDPSIATPQRTTTQFTLRGGGGVIAPSSTTSTPNLSVRSTPTANRSTPQDAFTQSVTAARLTPTVIAVSLLLALLFGGLHALSPGHGKTMVAAYLVGTHGTIRHAVLLGMVVTLTHTLVVYAVGLLTLIASRYVVPERLYPIISLLSGGMVFLLGLGMLAQRLWTLLSVPRGRHTAPEREGDYAEEWDRFATDDADTEDRPFTAVGVPETGAAISTRALIALGISGGALPCPSALVVLLSAIALHRAAFGLLLIVAYSLGLALVLTLIGIAVVKARGLLSRAPSGGRLMAALPVCSAAVITLLGCYLLKTAWAIW
jgi:nickel/cobalt transporter (NicO) family protein